MINVRSVTSVGPPLDSILRGLVAKKGYGVCAGRRFLTDKGGSC